MPEKGTVLKKKQYSVILFDLDGTLTDSGPGVMHGFEYAIRKMGREVPDGEQLRRFMGPPLQESFGRMLGYSEEDTARAVSLYREYYFSRGGIRENTVYPGVEQLLADLRQRGKTLAVATSKSTDGAEAVLEQFGLRKYFDLVAAADETDRITKEDVLQYACGRCGISPESAVMIGDRHYDIRAAKAFGFGSVGVLWGYGSREELEEAGADYIAERPEDILEWLGDSPEKGKTERTGAGSLSAEKDLRLYVPRPEDGWFYLKMMSDPATMAYNAPWFPPDGCIPDAGEEWGRLQESWIGHEPQRFYAYLQRKSDGAFVGDVNYHYNPDRGWWDMGIVIYAPERGKGYGTQGLRLLMDRAFRTDGIARLHNDFETTRGAAVRIHKFAGFREAGWEDGIVRLEITREEYLGRGRSGLTGSCG